MSGEASPSPGDAGGHSLGKAGAGRREGATGTDWHRARNRVPTQCLQNLQGVLHKLSIPATPGCLAVLPPSTKCPCHSEVPLPHRPFPTVPWQEQDQTPTQPWSGTATPSPAAAVPGLCGISTAGSRREGAGRAGRAAEPRLFVALMLNTQR